MMKEKLGKLLTFFTEASILFKCVSMRTFLVRKFTTLFADFIRE